MALSDCFSSVAGGRLIVGGGRDDERSHNNVYEYHPDTDVWKSLANMNTPRCGATAWYSESRKTLLVLGGRDGPYSALDSVEFLKIDATSQSPCWMMCRTPLPLKLFWHDIIAAGDNLYLTGGMDAEGGTSVKAFCGKLNGDGNDILWQPLPPMLQARCDHISFALQDKLFVAGGYGEGENTCECYDTQTDKWTLTSHKLPCDTLECYDTQTDKWSLTSHKFPCDTLAGACTTSDSKGKVIITGGYRDGIRSSKVTSFDLENGFKDISNFEMNEPIARHVALPWM